jgi:hypothetical protein
LYNKNSSITLLFFAHPQNLLKFLITQEGVKRDFPEIRILNSIDYFLTKT